MTAFKTNFGESITLPMANCMYKKAKEIRLRARAILMREFQNDPEALRYYVGQINSETGEIFEDSAFVFTKNSLVKIMKRILEDNADGMIIFPAARVNIDCTTQQPIPNQESGRPSVIVFPFRYELRETEDKKSTEVLISYLDDGFQHPGTGGGDEGDDEPRRDPFDIPPMYYVRDIRKKVTK